MDDNELVSRRALLAGAAFVGVMGATIAAAPARAQEEEAVVTGAALYTFLQPGIYAYVNHNLIEAVELGATAHFVVEGDWSDDLMKQLEAPAPIPSN